jgi:hypothetical protein
MKVKKDQIQFRLLIQILERINKLVFDSKTLDFFEGLFL